MFWEPNERLKIYRALALPFSALLFFSVAQWKHLLSETARLHWLSA